MVCCIKVVYKQKRGEMIWVKVIGYNKGYAPHAGIIFPLGVWCVPLPLIIKQASDKQLSSMLFLDSDLLDYVPKL